MSQQSGELRENGDINFIFTPIFSFLGYSFVIIVSAAFIEYVLVNAFNDGFSSHVAQHGWISWIFDIYSYIPLEYSGIILWIYSKYLPQLFGIVLILSFFYKLIQKLRKHRIELTVYSSVLIILFSFSFLLSTSSMLLLSGFISKNSEYTNTIKKTNHNEKQANQETSWQNGIIFGFEIDSPSDIADIQTKISRYNIRNIFIPHLLAQRLSKKNPPLWNSYIEMLKKAKKEYHVKIYIDLEAYFFDQVGLEFPPQAVLSMAYTPEEVYLLSRQYGTALKERMLVDYILGPVLDRKISPRDSLIEARSFSNNYEKIYIYASAMIAGFHDAGIVCIAKHFPGHPQVEIAPNNSHSKSFSFYSDQEIRNSSNIYIKLYDNENIKLRAILPDPVIIPAINSEKPFTIIPNGVSEFLDNDEAYGSSKLKNTLVVSDAITMVMGKYNEVRTNAQSNEQAQFIQDMCDSTIDLFNAGHDLVLTLEIKPDKIDEFNACLGEKQGKIKNKQSSGDTKASKLLGEVKESSVQWALDIPDNPALFKRGYALRLSSDRFAHKNSMARARPPKSILLLSTCSQQDDVYEAVKTVFTSSTIDSVIYKRSIDSYEVYLPSKGNNKSAIVKKVPESYSIQLINTIRDYDLVIISFDNFSNYSNVTKNYISTLIKERERLGNFDSGLTNKVLIVCATHPEFYYEKDTRIDFLKTLNKFPTYAVFRNTNNLMDSIEQIVCDMSTDNSTWEFCKTRTINLVNKYELNLPDYYYVNRLPQRDFFTCDPNYPTLYRRFLGTLGCNMYEVQTHTYYLGIMFIVLLIPAISLFLFQTYFYKRNN
jgi:Beta-glucosidase-related glycosidases